MSPRRLILPLIAVLLIGCTPAASSSPSVSLRPVTLLLGFRPDVQFAPFYLAQQEGYYADVGLDVSIEYKSGDDIARRLEKGEQIAQYRPSCFPVSSIGAGSRNLCQRPFPNALTLDAHTKQERVRFRRQIGRLQR